MFKIKKELISMMRVFSGVINDNRLINRRDYPMFLPFYHHVSDETPDYLKYLYRPRSVKSFERDIDYFLKHFTPVDLSELNDLVKSGKKIKAGKPIFHLSFDDGLRSCSEVIEPLLSKKGVPATFFVCKNFTEGKSAFYRFQLSEILNKLDSNKDNQLVRKKIINTLNSYGVAKANLTSSILSLNQNHLSIIQSLMDLLEVQPIQERIFMTKDEVKKLSVKGYSIGSHSLSHPLFSAAEENQIKQELEGSVKWVKETFNTTLNAFAFPFTDDGVSHEIYSWALNAEKPVADLLFGTSGLKEGKFPGHLQRVPMEMYQSEASSRIKAEYMYHNFREKSQFIKGSGNYD